jgi:hypothetical protein
LHQGISTSISSLDDIPFLNQSPIMVESGQTARDVALIASIADTLPPLELDSKGCSFERDIDYPFLTESEVEEAEMRMALTLSPIKLSTFPEVPDVSSIAPSNSVLSSANVLENDLAVNVACRQALSTSGELNTLSKFEPPVLRGLAPKTARTVDIANLDLSASTELGIIPSVERLERNQPMSNGDPSPVRYSLYNPHTLGGIHIEDNLVENEGRTADVSLRYIE